MFKDGFLVLKAGDAVPETSVTVSNGQGQQMTKANVVGAKTPFTVLQRLWRLKDGIGAGPHQACKECFLLFRSPLHMHGKSAQRFNPDHPLLLTSASQSQGEHCSVNCYFAFVKRVWPNSDGKSGVPFKGLCCAAFEEVQLSHSVATDVQQRPAPKKARRGKKGSKQKANEDDNSENQNAGLAIDAAQGEPNLSSQYNLVGKISSSQWSAQWTHAVFSA